MDGREHHGVNTTCGWVPGHGSADEQQPWLLLLPGEGVSEPRAALGGVLNPNSLHEGLPGPCGHRDVTAGLCQPASWGTSSRCLLCRGLGAPSGCGNVRNGAAGGIKKEKIEKEQAGRDSPVLLPGEGRVRCIFPVPSGARPSRGQGSWARRHVRDKRGLDRGWQGVGESAAADLVETRERK